MFADNLRRLREDKKLTYRELAETLNNKYDVKFSKSTIQRWEENDSSPSIQHATALAHFFEVTLDQLTTDKESLDVICKNNTQFKAAETIAIHIDPDASPEEVEEILAYIDMKRNLKKNRNK